MSRLCTCRACGHVRRVDRPVGEGWRCSNIDCLAWIDQYDRIQLPPPYWALWVLDACERGEYHMLPDGSCEPIHGYIYRDGKPVGIRKEPRS